MPDWAITKVPELDESTEAARNESISSIKSTRDELRSTKRAIPIDDFYTGKAIVPYQRDDADHIRADLCK